MTTSLTPAAKKKHEMRTRVEGYLSKGMQRFAALVESMSAEEQERMAKRMVQIALNATHKQPKLLDCTPETIAISLLNACETGLEPDGYHAHLIPYGKTCQFIPDYKGLIQLALINRVVIDAYVVYENDAFEYVLGSNPKIEHAPALEDRGEMKCAYAIARTHDGQTKFVVATKDDIEKRRKQSASSSKSDSPWKKWPEEMWKKTAVKMLMKFVPRSKNPRHSDQLTAAIRHDDDAERGLLMAPPGVSVGPSKADDILDQMGVGPEESETPLSFAHAVEQCETEEEVNRLYTSLIGDMSEEDLAAATEAAEVRKAVIRGDVK